MAKNESVRIYSATYSNVPVYEFNVEGNHVMRRRSDDWINATHILKVADYDKPTRTRILEREVQKGIHEKVQGGYGKYQGMLDPIRRSTWIPLSDGRLLAERNGVLPKLRPIFDFVPGDSSPPPAPKHATAASKPRAPRASAQQRKAPAYTAPPDYDRMDVSMQDAAADTPDNETVASEPAFDEYDASGYPSSRKRRRFDDPRVQAETQRRLWADELLDYFMLKENSEDAPLRAPLPPADADLNLPIDEKGHTPLHWAAAMGDLEVVKDLIRRGASIEVQSASGETPLMFATQYTNCFDKQIMDRVASLFIRTINMQEWYGGTVFHTIANTTERKSKYQSARYYLDCILNKMAEFISPDHIEQILNERDHNGDTAVTIAARNGARKCVRSLIGRNAAVDLPNHARETADQFIVQLNHRRQERLRQLSSSPFQGADGNIAPTGAVQPPNGTAFDPLTQHFSLNGRSVLSSPDGVYKSEAALTLTSQIMPSVFSKAKQLADSFDAEAADKAAELAEARRLVELRQSELDVLRRQAEQLRVRELEQTAGGAETDDAADAQLAELQRECLGLMEAEQQAELLVLFEAERARLGSLPDGLPDKEEGGGGGGGEADHQQQHSEATIEAKVALAREMAWLRDERRRLMLDVVQKTSLAGLEDGLHAQYARLIRGALGIDEEELHDVLPEIVDELEAGRAMEAGGA